jgi:hypothetical protein
LIVDYSTICKKYSERYEIVSILSGVSDCVYALLNEFLIRIMSGI